jgi:hypothetical protein
LREGEGATVFASASSSCSLRGADSRVKPSFDGRLPNSWIRCPRSSVTKRTAFSRKRGSM